MSWFFFIATDAELDECCVGIYQEGNTIIIENEDRTLNIYREQYEGYPERYTKLSHIVGVELGKYECVKAELTAYLKNAVLLCNQLEVWSIWKDDPDQNIKYRRFKAEELSETDIAWIFDQEYFEHPQCLKMYKWKRGAK